MAHGSHRFLRQLEWWRWGLIVALLFSLLGGALALAPTARAAAIVVNTTADENGGNPADCSLREAIIAANNNIAFGGCVAGEASPVVDTITFAIGAGPVTIEPLNVLPEITEEVFIDGTTQPGFTATPIVELRGTSAGCCADGLRIEAPNSTVTGLIVTRFSRHGIILTGDRQDPNPGGDTITGNVIVDNGDAGVRISTGRDSAVSGNFIINNTISGNGTVGIYLGTDNNMVHGNRIGLAAGGDTPDGNGGSGIRVDNGNDPGVGNNNLIGGTAPGEGNIIAHNGAAGVAVIAPVGTRILGNAIYANDYSGIDLQPDVVGPLPNDPKDPDTGANNWQNAPVLTAVPRVGGGSDIVGTLNSTPLTTFRLEFFTNPGRCPAIPPGGQGQTFVGTLPVTTDANGDAAFTFSTGALTGGQAVTATATSGDGLADGDTSEFSNCLEAANQPPVNGLPGAPTTNEDTPLAFSGGNALTVSDPDAGTAPLRVTLTATNGTATLGSTTGLAFTTGDGTADATMTFTGTSADINAALAGLVFTPAADYNGPASLQLTTEDQGATGSGGPQQDTDPLAITVTPINDAPSFVGGPDQAAVGDTSPRTVANWATNISPGPANESDQTLTFLVTNNNPDIFAVQPAISPDGTLTYTPAFNVAGSAVVAVRLKDNGGTANGGADTSPPQTFNTIVITTTTTYTVVASANAGGTITPSGTTTYAAGAGATYTATPNAGQVFLGWTLDGVYVGYASPLTFTVTGNHTLSARFAPRPTFADVPASDPDYEAITFLAALGVVNPAGVNGSGNFEPDREVVRAEMAAFVARVFGWQREFHANPFPDRCDPDSANCIDDELWNNVAALADYGVVGGYTDPATCASAGTTAPCYLPRDPVKRVQVLSIVARAFIKTPELRPTGFWDRLAADPAQYTNVPDEGTQRSDLTTYTANAGLIPGAASAATFPNPEGSATRRFVIQALYQAFVAQFGTDNVP